MEDINQSVKTIWYVMRQTEYFRSKIYFANSALGLDLSYKYINVS